MNKHFTKIYQSTISHKTLIQNFSYLSALQVFNILIPLITYPYLIRVLGKETYGLVVFAQAVIGYLVILVGFGFNISATKEISIHRDNKEKLSEIVSSVLIIKVILFLLSIVLLISLLFLIPKAGSYKLLFILTLWLCLYDVIFPMWYFQGIEKMKYITFLTLISRLIFLGFIFIFIHAPDDYLLIPVINGIGALIGGAASLIIIFSLHKVKFKWQSLNTIKYYFIDSIPIFISYLSIKLYVNTSKVLVGAFLGMTEVAYYDLAEKIVSIFKTPQSILSQVIFPKISKERNLTFVKKVFKYSSILNILIYILIVLSSKYIVLFLGGEQMLPSIFIINIVALSIPFISFSNIFAIQLLIPFGYNKTFSKVILTSALVYFIQILTLLLLKKFTLINISIVSVTTEIFVAGYAFYFCKKLDLWN